jgi:hypothetical protein
MELNTCATEHEGGGVVASLNTTFYHHTESVAASKKGEGSTSNTERRDKALSMEHVRRPGPEFETADGPKLAALLPLKIS